MTVRNEFDNSTADMLALPWPNSTLDRLDQSKIRRQIRCFLDNKH